ncbi:transcription initiation factor TFIID subunit 7 [Canna indica]|uniref:Transcription initiation factor TFIID subunit 7 n=1 Tax=Canna indica TaxID=4628 RepID=A0AAQ3JZ89_9LILI|nr:transcription initiation factor TFIID subunit 7 [Canna indica]
MKEQSILRVPPSVGERIECLLNENTSSFADGSLDISFSGPHVQTAVPEAGGQRRRNALEAKPAKPVKITGGGEPEGSDSDDSES